MKNIRTTKELKFAIEVAKDRKEFLIERLRLGIPNATTSSVKIISEELSELDSRISLHTKILKVTLHFEGKNVPPEYENVPPEDWTTIELAEYYVDEGINDTTLRVEEVMEIDRCDILSDVNDYIQNKVS